MKNYLKQFIEKLKTLYSGENKDENAKTPVRRLPLGLELILLVGCEACDGAFYEMKGGPSYTPQGEDDDYNELLEFRRKRHAL